MKITSYLIVSNRGNVRVTKTQTSIRANELAIKVTIDIPDRFFQRPVPVVTITLPPEALLDPTAASVVEITAEQVAAVMGLNVEDVRDGLMAAMQKREEDEKAGSA